MSRLEVFGLEGLPEVQPGDDLAGLIAAAAAGSSDRALADGDVVVVTQKIVSKAEGRLVPCADDVEARIALVESQSVRVLRRRGDVLITETPQGFVCANAGVDLSNVAEGVAALLPVDADRSARRIRDGLRAKAGVEVGVIVSDTFGRTWRNGQTDVAIGLAGVAGVVDLRGTTDTFGRVMQVTEIAVADEIAGAAELVMGKVRGVPVAVVRGVDPGFLREGSVKADIVRAPTADFFR